MERGLTERPIGTDTVYRIIILGHKKMPPVLDGQYRGFNVSMWL